MYKANGPHAQYGLSQLHSNNIQSGNKEGWKEEYPINGQVKNLVLRCFFIFESCKSNYNVHCLVLLLIQRCPPIVIAWHYNFTKR